MIRPTPPDGRAEDRLRALVRPASTSGAGAQGPAGPATADSPHARRAPHADRGSGITYYAGLDGIRAISVVAVLLYHAGVSWAHGGYLGVEVFFVISGYLITSLLLAERRSSGGIDLPQFWLRRARRLLPAMFAVVFATLVVSALFLRDELASLRGDAISALVYVTNWNFIFAEKSYFEAVGRPPLLQHLWSLAVEEQFYLVWPLLFAGGMKLLGRRRFVRVVMVGALASAVLMAVLYDPTSSASRNRVYLGTDTRASGLLIGCVLAFWWAPGRIRKERTGRHAAMVLDVGGLLSLVGLAWMLSVTSEYSTFLYRGGFVVLSLLTAVLIAAVVHPSARIGRLLGVAPLRWIGLRSYGIYLWHWPIFQLTRPELDVPLDGVALFALRMGLTLVVAAASYTYLEQPIRHGALGRSWTRMRTATGGEGQALRQRWVAACSAIGVALALVVVVTAMAKPGGSDYAVSAAGGAGPGAGAGAIDPSQLSGITDPNAVADPFARLTSSTSEPGPTAPPTSDGAGDPGQDPEATSGPPGSDGSGGPGGSDVPPSTEPAESTSSTTPRIAPALTGKRVALLGDSVMLGASPSLQAELGPAAVVSAQQNRQVSDGIAILKLWKEAGWISDAEIVIHLGNNGTFFAEQFDQIMDVLKDAPRVVFVTVRVPRPWEESVNQTIVEGVPKYPNAVLVDWRTASEGQTDWFYDGMHLRPDAAPVYADLIASAL